MLEQQVKAIVADQPVKKAPAKKAPAKKTAVKKSPAKKTAPKKTTKNEVMPLEEKCQMAGCARIATRITTTETKYIVICEECWHDKYRK